MKRFKINNGLAFYPEFNTFCKENDIAKQSIITETPYQNDLIRRFNKTIVEKVR